jgi:hypothetical protein
MKKNLIIIISIILLILLILLIVKSDFEEKPFKNVVLSENNQIINRTNINYYDTILNVGLDELKIEGISVVVIEMTENMRRQFNGELKAHVRFHENVYYLFIGNENRSNSIDIISHEIIHINQYHTNQIVFDGIDIVTWEGQPFGKNDIEYELRPWEIDAFKKQNELSARINNILY